MGHPGARGAARGRRGRPRGDLGRPPMATVAKAPPAPRYGSVAELARYASLSPKTIRRLIGAGKIRGLKVGRRVLVSFVDLDRHVLRSAGRHPQAPDRETPRAVTTAPT